MIREKHGATYRIEVKKGLDIPLSACPNPFLHILPTPKSIALNLDPFEQISFKLLVKVGDFVKIGSPLLENKKFPGQFFVSPASGIISEIKRGAKRALQDIVIAVSEKETFEDHKGINLQKISKQELLNYFLKTGLFAHIRMRPFDLVATPKYLPRAIFVKALESLPYVPKAEMQLEGNDLNFQIGLDALQKISKVFLVYHESSMSHCLNDAKGVEKVLAKGPHPISNHSVHIHQIAPIIQLKDYVWTTSAIDVIAIGKMVREGHYYTERIIALAGEGIQKEKRGYYKTRLGVPISLLVKHVSENTPSRLISGDPLCGKKVQEEDFLHFNHTVFTALLEQTTREPFHFLRLGLKKYSFHRSYFSPSQKMFNFSTNQHGEERAFIDGTIYDKVMPMRIPTMNLIKAILAEDFELAEQLGLLEVTSEDFALPTFICPSKIEMMDIVKKGLKKYSHEIND